MAKKFHEKIDSPHAVYRFWCGNRLLYVGCTFRFPERMTHHACTKGWFPEVDRITIEWFPDFLTGRQAETQAILNERPEKNDD